MFPYSDRSCTCYRSGRSRRPSRIRPEVPACKFQVRSESSARLGKKKAFWESCTFPQYLWVGKPLSLPHSGFSEPIQGPKPDDDHMALPVPDIGLTTSFAMWVEISSTQLRKVQGSLANIALYSKGFFLQGVPCTLLQQNSVTSWRCTPIRKGLSHKCNTNHYMI